MVCVLVCVDDCVAVVVVVVVVVVIVDVVDSCSFGCSHTPHFEASFSFKNVHRAHFHSILFRALLLRLWWSRVLCGICVVCFFESG